MEPTIPTSFIPKRPVTSEVLAPERKNHTIGLLSFLTVIIVLATIVSYGGVYVYHRSLVAQKNKLVRSINDARGGIGTDFLADMKRLNARIAGVKTLVQNHIVVSPIFEALHATTLRSIQYKSFQYEFTTETATKSQLVKVSLDGVAKNYSTIALQSDAFAQNHLIKNPVFSDLTVDDKSNVVNFKLQFEVNPTDLSFERFINATAPASAQPQP